MSTFHLSRLFISWDVDLNPGPNNVKPKCHKCSRTIARNHRSLNCSSFGFKYHMKCGEVAVKQFKLIQTNDPSIWTCPACQEHHTPEWETNFTLLQSLPFAPIANDSFLNMADSEDTATTPSQLHKEEDENHLLDLAQKLETCSSEDLRVAHLNVCSLRNKIEELRCLQLICRFEILAITETHLDKTVSDETLDINGMKFVRLDRKRRKGDGCVLYYAEHLKAIHRKDLYNDNLEAMWLQVKFPSNSLLFSVMYRRPDACDFFDRIRATLEKAWLKTSNIILLGDFNCDLLNRGSPEIPVNTNAEKICSVFERRARSNKNNYHIANSN